MKGKVTFDGFDELEATFRASGPRARDALFRALQDGAQRMENRAKRGIAKGPKTGRRYTHRFPYVFGQDDPPASHKRPPHQASAPGEYPAADTGKLMGSIRHEELAPKTDERLLIDLIAATDYAAPLEFKPPEKGGRPFLGRAALEESESVVEDAEARLRRTEGLP